MRNLIRIYCKRYLFRWETFAATMLNLLLTVFCTLAAILLFEPDNLHNESFYNIMHVVSLISICFTMAAVIFTEINTLATGAVRNPLIAGYSKGQVFLSKYIAVGIFSIVQGTLFLLPPVLANIWIDHPVLYTVSMLLVYAVVSCIAMTVCLLTDRPTVYVVICIGCLIAMLLGGKAVSSILDTPQFIFVRIQQETIVKEEDPWYVPSPQRDILEQCIMVNPVQPLNEYGGWYFKNKDTSGFAIDSWAQLLAQSRSEAEKEYNQLMLQKSENALHLHTDRFKLFPVYQTAFLILFGFGSMVIFRKRNLK